MSGFQNGPTYSRPPKSRCMQSAEVPILAGQQCCHTQPAQSDSCTSADVRQMRQKGNFAKPFHTIVTTQLPTVSHTPGQPARGTPPQPPQTKQRQPSRCAGSNPVGWAMHVKHSKQHGLHSSAGKEFPLHNDRSHRNRGANPLALAGATTGLKRHTRQPSLKIYLLPPGR